MVHYNGLPKPFAISVMKHLLQSGDIEAFKFLVVERYAENKHIMGSNYEPNLLDEIKDSYYFAERIGREGRMERLENIGWVFGKD